MMRLALTFVSLFCVLVVIGTLRANAQSLRIRMEQEQPTNGSSSVKKNWPMHLGYSVGSDYADDRKPRGYNNRVFGSVGYEFNDNLSFGFEASAKAKLVDGAVEKNSQQTESESLSPGTSGELTYSQKFPQTKHGYFLSVSGEPFWDEASRREGYLGIYGAGIGLSFKFFGGIYSMGHSLGVSQLNNTYEYSSEGTYNPDTFTNYSLSNSLNFAYGLKLSYNFGVKYVKYLDQHTDSQFNNSFTLARAWGNASTAMSYENGGYTSYNDISLWYLDQFRRIFRISIGYSF